MPSAKSAGSMRMVSRSGSMSAEAVLDRILAARLAAEALKVTSLLKVRLTRSRTSACTKANMRFRSA